MFSIAQDPERTDGGLWIRARRREHLEALVARFAGLVSRRRHDEILENAGTDYEFRVAITPAELGVLLYKQAESIDYSNFKSAADEVHRAIDPAEGEDAAARLAGFSSFSNMLHDVWDCVQFHLSEPGTPDSDQNVPPQRGDDPAERVDAGAGFRVKIPPAELGDGIMHMLVERILWRCAETPAPQFDRERHGGLYDRGSADAYYQRDPDPHWWPEETGKGEKITELSELEIAEYMLGYDEETETR
jgi:hypothetical protein